MSVSFANTTCTVCSVAFAQSQTAQREFRLNWIGLQWNDLYDGVVIPTRINRISKNYDALRHRLSSIHTHNQFGKGRFCDHPFHVCTTQASNLVNSQVSARCFVSCSLNKRCLLLTFSYGVPYQPLRQCKIVNHTLVCRLRHPSDTGVVHWSEQWAVRLLVLSHQKASAVLFQSAYQP